MAAHRGTRDPHPEQQAPQAGGKPVPAPVQLSATLRSLDMVHSVLTQHVRPSLLAPHLSLQADDGEGTLQGSTAACRMLLWVAAPTAVTASIQHMWGLKATFVLMGQALTAVVLLEAVNFVEHYGLQRKHLPSGRWGLDVARWPVETCCNSLRRL